MTVAVNAWVKIFCRARKRGPGVDAIGKDGGGDGEGEVRTGITNDRGAKTFVFRLTDKHQPRREDSSCIGTEMHPVQVCLFVVRIDSVNPGYGIQPRAIPSLRHDFLAPQTLRMFGWT